MNPEPASQSSNPQTLIARGETDLLIPLRFGLITIAFRHTQKPSRVATTDRTRPNAKPSKWGQISQAFSSCVVSPAFVADSNRAGSRRRPAKDLVKLDFTAAQPEERFWVTLRACLPGKDGYMWPRSSIC